MKLRNEVESVWRWVRQFWPWHKRPAYAVRWSARHLLGCGRKLWERDDFVFVKNVGDSEIRAGRAVFTKMAVTERRVLGVVSGLEMKLDPGRDPA